MSQTNPPAAVATPRTKLKINIAGRRPSIVDGGGSPAPGASTPGASASASTPGPPQSAKTVIKIKAIKTPKVSSPATNLASATPATPIVSAKTKAGRQTKPTAKLVEANKHDLSDLDDDDDSDQPVKKIKLRQNGSGPGKTVRIKHKGKPVDRVMGEGYDSEASDREDDPTIEQQFIIRMPPGEHCEYLRRAIEENKFDPKYPERKLADIALRFFDDSSKRAVMTVLGQHFAAVMVDLPTITETMKTWDRKSLVKSADVCQMLLVFKLVGSIEEARTAPLPLVVEHGNKWPHGLTPPMHDCVRRRFAKTISRKEIEDKDAEVERLLAEDAKALTTEWRWYDPSASQKSKGGAEALLEEDAEGEPDDDDADAAPGGAGSQDMDGDDGFDDDDLFENELQNAFDMADAEQEGQAGVPPAAAAAETPAPGATQQQQQQQESDDEEEDDDEDDEADDDEDDDDEGDESDEEEVSEEQQSRRATLEIIADLRRQRALKTTERDRANLGIMRQRLDNQIRSITSEIKNKLRSIGMEDEEDMESEEE
jgi:transcription initiation factor TFIID subunit 7